MVRKTVVFLLFFVAMNCIAGIAHALPLEGGELYGFLAGETDGKNYSNAVYYIRGAADALQGVEIDIPQAVTTTQIVQTVFAHLRGDTQARNLLASAVVHDALKKAYPLKK